MSHEGYGKCPVCGEPGVGCERCLDGHTWCASGHKYLHSERVYDESVINLTAAAKAEENRIIGQNLNAQQLKDYVLGGLKQKLQEKAPPDWSGTVAAMRKHKEIRNPYALAWHMKDKGDKPHYEKQPGNDSTSDDTPRKKKKYKDD